MTSWAEAACVGLTYAFNLAMMAGTAYLVQVFDWSPWWFLVPAVFFITIKTGKAAERRDADA